jgi:hypothetical protein
MKAMNTLFSGLSFKSKVLFVFVFLFVTSKDTSAQITLTPVDSFEIDTNQFNYANSMWRPWMGLLKSEKGSKLAFFDKKENRLTLIDPVSHESKSFKIPLKISLAASTTDNIFWVNEIQPKPFRNYIRSFLFIGDSIIQLRKEVLKIKKHTLVPSFQTSEPYQMMQTTNDNVVLNVMRNPKRDSSKFDSFNYYSNEAFYDLSPTVATFHFNTKSATNAGWFSNFPNDYKQKKFISYLFYNTITINPRNKEIYVMYPISPKIDRYSFDGKHLGSWGSPSKHLNSNFEYPGYYATERTFSYYRKDSLRLVAQEYRIMYLDSLHNLLFVAAHPSGIAPEKIVPDTSNASRRKVYLENNDNIQEAFNRKETALQIYDLSKPSPELIYDELISDGYFFEIVGIQDKDLWVLKYNFYSRNKNPLVIRYKLNYK